MNQVRTIRRWSHASLACSLGALVSHTIAMSVTSTVVVAIAQRQPLGDQAQRIASADALNAMAIAAGFIALMLALLAARRETPRMRTLVFTAAVVANVWNFMLV